LDILGYTAILIPSMNAISALVGTYHYDLDTLPNQLVSMGLGMGSFIAKHSFNFLVNKLRDKFNLKVDSELDEPTLVRPYDIKDGDTKNLGRNKLIKEQ
jgi:hypothetical protein